MTDKEPGLRETPCPHCGGEANCRFLDDAKSRVEVVCSDCGRFEMSREEFDQAASEIVEPDDSH